MSTTPLPIITLKSNKSVSSSSQKNNLSHSPTIQRQPEVFQRRNGGFGGDSKNSGSPRNKQDLKSKHKQSNRLKLTDEDAFAESAAMQSTSSRKGQTSITHLLDLSLPRPQLQPQHRYTNGSRTVRRTNNTWGIGSGYHASDKARYVHANYRFIVDPRGDYKIQSMDADVHLDWNNVLQILVSPQSQQAACPICLGDPVAPRMAKCGHIFCLPCLIRYMHSDDAAKTVFDKRPRWKKCPICHDSVYISETRSVRWYQGQEGEQLREGMDVVLRLVGRAAGSTLAMPRESPDALSKGEYIPWYNAAEVMDYARVIKGGENYMSEQIQADVAAVKTLEHEDELMFGEDTEWTGKAIRMLYESKDKIQELENPPIIALKPSDRPIKKPPIIFNTDHTDVPDMFTLLQSPVPDITVDKTTSAITNSLSTSDGTTFQSPLRSPSSTTPDEYLFYNSLRHHYLSPLDIRILSSAFGSYSSFPSSILPRIERISSGHVIDDDLRKKVKYLGHLPYGCEVNFLECDWTDTVPPQILDRFKPDLERRRKRKTDKEAREEKERARAEELGDREFAYAAGNTSSSFRRKKVVDSTTDDEEWRPLAGTSPGGFSATSFDIPHRQGSAFSSLATSSETVQNGKTVWGTTALSQSVETAAEYGKGNVDDGWLQDWEKELLLDDADDEMIARMEAVGLKNADNSEGSSLSTKTGTGKGKKKVKKLTLMSTTGRRAA